MKSKNAQTSKRDGSGELLGGWLPRSWYGEDAEPGSSYAKAHITQHEIEAAREACADALNALASLREKLGRGLLVEPGRYNLDPRSAPGLEPCCVVSTQCHIWPLQWFLRDTSDRRRG
jgi:hypothetical protein